MKKLVLMALILLSAAGWANAQTMAKADAVIKMAKEKYDLGKIKHNEPVTFYMEFTNISKRPIVVENVMVGCGCTVAEKPAAPIAAGKSGKVKVVYNASANGIFTKDVTIKIAKAEPKIVYFSGETFE